MQVSPTQMMFVLLHLDLWGRNVVLLEYCVIEKSTIYINLQATKQSQIKSFKYIHDK